VWCVVCGVLCVVCCVWCVVCCVWWNERGGMNVVGLLVSVCVSTWHVESIRLWYVIQVELDDVTNNKTMTIVVNMKQAYMASL